MMRWLVVILLGLLCFTAAFTASKPRDEKPKVKPTVPDYTGPKKRLGVMDMEVKITSTATTNATPTGSTSTTSVNIPPPSDFGQGLTEMLTSALIDTKRFILLERKALGDIQAEQTLGAGGTVQADSASTPGKLLGAQLLIRGAVTEFTYRQSSTGGSVSVLRGVGVGATNTEAAVVLDIRMYDTTTGQIIDSVKADGSAKASGIAINIDKDDLKMSASNFSQTPLGHATRQAIEKAVAAIVARMETLPWEANIAEMDADNAGTVTTLYINAGSDMGLKAGDELDIFHPGRPIVDPKTKLVIGRTKDTKIGHCRIDTVTAALATATPMEGTGFKVEDVVRFVEAPKPPPNSPPPGSCIAPQPREEK